MKQFHTRLFLKYPCWVDPKVFACVAVLLLTSSYYAPAQVYPYNFYSVRDGLINAQVFAIAQDHSGYMWFATENGLSRFNGTTFKNFPLDTLDIHSFISSLYAAKDGWMYLGTGTEGVYRFDRNLQRATRINAEPVSQSSQLEICGDTLVSLHEYHGFEFISLTSGKLLLNDSLSKADVTNKGLCMTRLRNNDLLFGRSEGLYQWLRNKQHKLEIKGMGNVPVYSIWEDSDGSLLVGSDGLIFRIRNLAVTDTIHAVDGPELRIRNIVTDDQGKIWFNTWGTHQIFTLSGDGRDHVSDVLGISNGTVSKIMVDRDGGIWAGILRKGVFNFHHRHMLNYPASASMTHPDIRKIIQLDDRRLLLGTDDGLAVLDRFKRTIRCFKHMPEMTQYIRGLAVTGAGEYVAAITDIRLRPFTGSFPLDNKNVASGRLRYAHASSLWADSSILMAGNWDNKITIYKLPGYNVVGMMDFVFPDSPSKLRINCIFRDPAKQFWIGSQAGLVVIDSSGKTTRPVAALQQEEVHQIRLESTGQVDVIADGGIYIFQTASASLHEFIQVANTRCGQRISEGEYLVGTHTGLVHIKNKISRILTVPDGLPSDNINDIWFDEKHQVAWIATSDGLLELQLNYLHSPIPALKVQEVKLAVGSRTWIDPVDVQIPWSKNSITLQFTAFHFENPRAVTYEYRFAEEPWTPAPSGEIRLTSLEPGKHVLQMRARLPGNYSGATKTLRLMIIPPFYMTWWFYTVVIAGATLLALSFARIQLQKIRARQESESRIQQKLAELRQQALANNLNPHFIFNSLNSIQHFINANSPDAANEYLARFSRLMRMHLDMAGQSFISVGEELMRLEFYLGLEHLRYGNKLKWEFKTGPGIDFMTTLLPNMIIQPFLENAIWHGIMPTGKAGEIKLEINKNGDEFIEIKITDNGIGISQASHSANPGHESKGTLLILERLKLLDPEVTEPVSFSDALPGTTVTIRLSQKMYRIVASN